MKKHICERVVSVVLLIVIGSSISMNAYADVDAKNSTERPGAVETRGQVSGTLTTSHGDKIACTGTTIALNWTTGSSITVNTTFSVTYYSGGTQPDKDRVNGYAKDINTTSYVTFTNGGTASFKSSGTRYGAAGNVGALQEYIYMSTAYTYHTVSCNGGSWNGTSYS
ncbi:MAG: hypothetical protein FWH40_08345 [Coriobacteriia bacterium]|nr:hypothetical protein [Coriobacteriia bacterium]